MVDRVRLYLDEDAQRTTLVRALRARQVDVLTATEAGTIGFSDAEQLEFAASRNRTVFTFNRGDFAKLHTEYVQREQEHSGIIVSDQLEIGIVIRRASFGCLMLRVPGTCLIGWSSSATGVNRINEQGQKNEGANRTRRWQA